MLYFNNSLILCHHLFSELQPEKCENTPQDRCRTQHVGNPSHRGNRRGRRSATALRWGDAHHGAPRREGGRASRGSGELGIDVGAVSGHLDVRLAGRAGRATCAVGDGRPGAPLSECRASNVHGQVTTRVSQVEATECPAARL